MSTREQVVDLLIELAVDCIGLAINAAIISASVICTVKVLMWMFE